MTDLRSSFLEALAVTLRPQAEAVADLDARLAALVEAARGERPGLDLDPTFFVAYVAARLPSEDPIERSLDGLYAADLYLACACAGGDTNAIVILERDFGGHIIDAVRRVQNKQMLPEDFRQILRRKLFVAQEDAEPAIARYSGYGTLAAWLRVTASRAAINAARDTRGDAPSGSGELWGLNAELPDPELDYLRATYAQEFRSAFTSAVEALAPRDRTLLRLSVVDRVPVREIGKMYGAHHATAARWIARARQALVDTTRKYLAERLDLSARELDSIMLLIRSRLDVSIARVLQAEGSEPEPEPARHRRS